MSIIDTLVHIRRCDGVLRTAIASMGGCQMKHDMKCVSGLLSSEIDFNACNTSVVSIKGYTLCCHFLVLCVLCIGLLVTQDGGIAQLAMEG